MMRIRSSVPIALFLLGVASVVVALPQDKELSSPALRVEWAEFKKLYDAKKIEVIDVRGDSAFEQGHIPGARSVPLDQVERRTDSLARLKKPLVTYCS